MTKRESQTRLAKIRRLRAPDVTFLVSEGRLRVTLPGDSSLAKALTSLPPTAAFALLTRPSAHANAILVWKPGQDGFGGISPDGSDGSRVSGSCLMFVPGVAADAAHQFEDGYSITLTSDSWAMFSSAVRGGRALSLPLADGLRLELELELETR